MDLQNIETELADIEKRIEKAKNQLKTLKRMRLNLCRMLEEAKKLS